MWDDSADASIKIVRMKNYAESLYSVLIMASEEHPDYFQTENQLYGEFSNLLYPLVLALERYDEEEFPIPEEQKKQL
ncbi:hypothetical protein DSCW_43310 [Desulfosarcina widdelii]|uniref:Uncharacterized protein n=1 Tax=Desulfosarcina widdelii TaxID=947919 RepID=A0A5K7ZET6_9BACT|nr:hypothetical protein [Desulfosarcina widdelii]BBO76914.1 hypothetical protein DSCW_43310 [Desulfosarcina widdelii]